MEKLSKHSQSGNQLISNTGLPKGSFYERVIPKHRFVNYSKAQVHHEIKSGQFQPESFKDLNFSFVEADKKLDQLKPSLNLVLKADKP